MSTSVQLTIEMLGPTGPRRLKRLYDEFESRGWRDQGDGAITVIYYLDDHGGRAGWRALAHAVPSIFLARNRIKRRDLELFFQDLISRLSR
jgi:hypothetical protein